MSEENVEIARRFVDAWNRQSLDELLSLCSADIVYVNSPTAVEPGTRHGLAEVEAVFRAQWEILMDAKWDIDRIYDRDDTVTVLGRLSRGLPDSDARMEERVLTFAEVQNGKTTRLEVRFGSAEVQEALGAAGLSE